MRTADLMIFNSRYMRRAYRENAGFEEKASEIVYAAISERTHCAASRLRGTVPRKRHQVLSVSVMAPHKGIETVVQAVRMLHERYGIPARLLLVGRWADRRYEARIRELVDELALWDDVEFKGHVSRRELHVHYAESEAFCLMSKCESFGIPAVEAQAFGTPVVSSNRCAIPRSAVRARSTQTPTTANRWRSDWHGCSARKGRGRPCRERQRKTRRSTDGPGALDPWSGRLTDSLRFPEHRRSTVHGHAG